MVPSAPGKRFPEDTKVTDLLYACYNKAAAGEDFSRELKEISDRYYEIIRGLELSLSLEEEFQQIEKDFKAQAGTDYAASRGEVPERKDHGGISRIRVYRRRFRAHPV